MNFFPREAPLSIAVVGLGRMGEALAHRLLEQNVPVVVWNRSPEPALRLEVHGATVAPSLAAVWQEARTAFTFLSDDTAVESVCLGEDGLITSARAGNVLVEMSTISPTMSARVAEHATEASVVYLRCPVSGNPDVLAAGNLLLIASGDRDALDAAQPALALVAPNLRYVGASEEARVVKLAVNAVLAATTQMLAETIALCEAAGVKRAAYLDALAASALGSPFVRYKRDALVEHRYDATFTTAMLHKDLALTLDAGNEQAIPMPLTVHTADLTSAACESGLGDYDFLALLPYLQMLAGRSSDVPDQRSQDA